MKKLREANKQILVGGALILSGFLAWGGLMHLRSSTPPEPAPVRLVEFDPALSQPGLNQDPVISERVNLFAPKRILAADTTKDQIKISLKASTTKKEEDSAILDAEDVTVIESSGGDKPQSGSINEAFEEAPDQPVVSKDSTRKGVTLLKDHRAWAWVGVGANYQFYEQSVESFGTADFQNIETPSLFFKAGFSSQSFGIDLSYSQTPGEIQSSSTATLPSGSYTWESLATDVFYQTSSSQSDFRYRFGLQHHSLPFLVQNRFSSEVELLNSQLSMLTVGVDQSLKLSSDLRFEWLFRYQFPIISTADSIDSLEINPRLGLDASFGGVMSLGEKLRGGIYWNMQYQDFDFHIQRSGASDFSGNQTLFYSNVEVRIGFEI